MRPSIGVLVAVTTLVVAGLDAQLREDKIELSNVALQEDGWRLVLDITNIYTEPITAYRVSTVHVCSGKVLRGPASVQAMFSPEPEEVDERHSSSLMGRGIIQPGATRRVQLGVGDRRTPQGPCEDVNLSGVTAVFADGTGTGNRDVVLEIVNYRRGESKQYNRWLAPYEQALASDAPATALAQLIERLDAEFEQFHFRDNDHFEEGERYANRSIRGMVDQLLTMYRDRSSAADYFAPASLRRHRQQAEALRRY